MIFADESAYQEEQIQEDKYVDAEVVEFSLSSYQSMAGCRVSNIRYLIITVNPWMIPGPARFYKSPSRSRMGQEWILRSWTGTRLICASEFNPTMHWLYIRRYWGTRPSIKLWGPVPHKIIPFDERQMHCASLGRTASPALLRVVSSRLVIYCFASQMGDGCLVLRAFRPRYIENNVLFDSFLVF